MRRKASSSLSVSRCSSYSSATSGPYPVMANLSKHLDASYPPSEQISCPMPWRYDVFINFRGDDIRRNFLSFLYEALVDAGVVVFKDDKGIRIGREISHELIRAIRSSRIAVVLFSTRYVESRWCLMELAEIVDARQRSGQLVLPVFYHVDVQQVRCQIGDFAEPFNKLGRNFDKERILSWRKALTETANIMGFKTNGNNDAVLVKVIVQSIKVALKDINGAQTKVNSCQAVSPGYELWSNDVFLCYRGPDTRANFTNHLYHALIEVGLNTFMAGESMFPGQDISLCPLRAIRTSRFSVVVFSKGFANSKTCLDELAEIMEWRKAMGQLVIPVFYNIDPKCVRHQTGCFEGAFRRYEQRFKLKKGKVPRWRTSLTKAGSLSGFHVWNSGISEANVVKNIVRKISIALNDQTYLHVATFPVGLVSHLHDINKCISAGTGGVLFVGLFGLGGIGKTTLAKAIYNQMSHLFESKSFIADVSVRSRGHGDVIPLQEQLLDDILKLKKTVSNVDEGTRVLGEKLRGKEALVILDGVSDLDQIRKLAQRDWFCPGSRIIITTRSHSLLKEIEVDSVYEVEALNNEEALQLFSSQAFRKTHPEEEFLELSQQVVSYCNEVPLALTVLGASLYQKSVEEWKSTIEKLQNAPNSCLLKQLEISFDALSEIQKTLFLDIACLYTGQKKDHVVQILECRGLFVEEEIGYLINRCLVEVDEKNKLKMHGMLQDMGREIVRRESFVELGKRSRLWSHEEALSVLTNGQGTEAVEGIALDSGSDQIKLSAEVFSGMTNLTHLELKNVQLDGDYRHISRELRCLSWDGFSDQFIPDDLYMEKLDVICMGYSNLKAFGNSNRHLNMLKFLDLSNSSFLTGIPDFSMFPRIKRLKLEGCVGLVELHQSIGCLIELVYLNLKDCKSLIRLPDSIANLKSLQTLIVSGCPKINEFPQELGLLESLVEIDADGTAICNLPLSFNHLKNLSKLSLSSSVSAMRSPKVLPSFSKLSSLKELTVVGCLELGDVLPEDFGVLLSLEHLDLRKSNFRFLPDSICSLTKLQNLLLDDCSRLELLADLPASLYSLSAVNCTSLERVSFSEFGSGTQLFLSGCTKLTMVSGLDYQVHGGIVHLEQCSNLKTEFQEFLLKDWTGEVFLRGSNIPDWFQYQTSDSSLSFEIPPIQGNGLKEFTICVTYAPSINNNGMGPSPRVRIEPFGIPFFATNSAKITFTSDDHMWVFHLPDYTVDEYMEYAGQLTISADFGVGWDVKGLGVHYGKETTTRPNQIREIGSVDAGSVSGVRCANENAWKYTESATIHMNASETSYQEISGCLAPCCSTAIEKPETLTTDDFLNKQETFHQGIQYGSCHSPSYCGATCGSFIPHSSDDSSGKNGEEAIITYSQNQTMVNLQEWSRYLGRVVRSRHICPLAIHSWEGIGNDTLDHMWAVVKDNIQIIHIESFRDCTLTYMKELWTKWRTKMYNKYVKEMPVAIALKNKPKDVHANDWKWLIEHHWSKESFQDLEEATRSEPKMPKKSSCKHGHAVTYRQSLKHGYLKKKVFSLGRGDLESRLTEAERENAVLKRENIALKHHMKDIGSAFGKVFSVMSQNFLHSQSSKSYISSYDASQGNGVQSPLGKRRRRFMQPQLMIARKKKQRDKGESFICDDALSLNADQIPRYGS